MKKFKNLKITFLSIFIFVAGTLLLVNVLLLDMKGTKFFSDINFRDQVGVSITTNKIAAVRGNIYDAKGNVLATEKRVYKVIFILSNTHTKTVVNADGTKSVVPDYVQDPATTARKICDLLGADYDYVYGRLTSGYYQVEIGTKGSNLDFDVMTAIQDLNLPGITFDSSIVRYYPKGAFASHLLGFTQINYEDNAYTLTGISGIESQLNEYLAGTDGKETFYGDVSNSKLVGGLIAHEDATNGYNVNLTIEPTIQEAADDFLEKVMKLSGAEKAWTISINAKTGAIYSYDSYPTFDPNTMIVEDYNDYVATMPYEPGSTMKTFTYATAIDLGGFDKDELFNANTYYVGQDEKGNLKRVDRSRLVIHNSMHKQYGMTSFFHAYVNSYNVGTVTLLEEQIGKENFEKYINSFGFYKAVDVYGINEGDFHGNYTYDDVMSLACASFGSGNSATALQLIQGYTAFCNGGTLIRPYIIDSIVDPVSGDVVYEGERTEVGQPVSASTASQILELMHGMTATDWYPSAKRALHLDGIEVGAKTGTSPIANEQGEYDNSKYIHSMMIAFPIEDPEVLLYVAYQDGQITQRYFNYLSDYMNAIVDVLALESKQSQEGEELKETAILDNYVNHSLNYVEKKAADYGYDFVVIGNGEDVVRQYPEAGTKVLTGQRVMLLTAGDEIQMPDMTGWSRSEVMAYWDLTGIGVRIDGYGYVVSQSIEPGTLIDKTLTIEVKLEDVDASTLYPTEETVEEQQENSE